ncbi:MAG: purine-binding chemotaxis protein CheW [Melioribacteraceae bacterium]|nr:purine-binding chemotaxis protein CheW [Melioribacteraceae bacterium]
MSKTENLENILQLVTFKINCEEFGIDIFKVREINKMMQITKVPNAPYYVEGVVNLRGKVIPVIDLRLRLGMERKEYNNQTRIVVAELADKHLGFVVDEVNEVLRIPEEIIETPPEIVSGIDSDYITAVAKLEERLLILLDINKLVNIEQFNKVA